MTRINKDAVWDTRAPTTENAKLGVLMDIRDELKEANRQIGCLLSLARCYRIPRALDAMIELGQEARRRKRLAAKRRKAARAAK